MYKKLTVATIILVIAISFSCYKLPKLYAALNLIFSNQNFVPVLGKEEMYLIESDINEKEINELMAKGWFAYDEMALLKGESFYIKDNGEVVGLDGVSFLHFFHTVEVFDKCRIIRFKNQEELKYIKESIKRKGIHLIEPNFSIPLNDAVFVRSEDFSKIKETNLTEYPRKEVLRKLIKLEKATN